MMSMRRIMKSAHEKGLSGIGMQEYLTENRETLNDAVTQDDFLIALKKIGKSVGGKDLKKYESWMEEFGSS